MPGDASDLGALAGVAIVRLTTIGRRTGRPRTVELWFAYHEGHIYLLGHPESNWVKNVSANPRVTLEMDFEGHGLVGKALAPLARRDAAKIVPANLQRLKDRLEAGA